MLSSLPAYYFFVLHRYTGIFLCVGSAVAQCCPVIANVPFWVLLFFVKCKVVKNSVVNPQLFVVAQCFHCYLSCVAMCFNSNTVYSIVKLKTVINYYAMFLTCSIFFVCTTMYSPVKFTQFFAHIFASCCACLRVLNVNFVVSKVPCLFFSK